MTVFIWILQIIFVPAVSPLGVGFINKVKARLQNRRGASIFQPYKDLWKLMHKDEVISRDASWIFYYAPYIVFLVTLILAASVPLFSSFLHNVITGDLLSIVYLIAFGTFFLALAGLDVGGPFGGFGSSREMTISAMAEGGLIFSLLAVAINAGTSNLLAMSALGSVAYDQHLLPMILAFVGFFIVLLAETARFPFDNPATHLELTMVHEAMLLEYSGKRLALMEWAAANKLLCFIAIGANIFFPWGLATDASVVALALGIGLLLIKVFIFCLTIALIESGMAKFRFFRLPDLLFISFILSVMAISLTQIL